MLNSLSGRASEPASPSKIATAARAFGDDYPPVRGQWRIRVAGLLLIATTLFYTPWVLNSLNQRVPWLSWPFAVANLFSMAYGLLAVFNAWSRKVPARRALPRG